MFTYTYIYQNVVNEIKKRIAFTTGVPYKNQLDRAQTFSASTEPGRTTSGLIETIQVIQDLLMNSIPGTIIEGLNVTATFPISSNVTVEHGKGSIGGQEYSLRDDTLLVIPLTDEGSIYYILLFGDRIIVSKSILQYYLPIAKIVVPNPGVTSLIQDQKDETGNTRWNAYIVNLREYKLYGDKNGNLEEDSIEFLKDAIGHILAENIFGNITLSENLKLTNIQGTLELDSKEMRILDSNENILAKFNSNGTYFYNTSGQELSKFTKDVAKVGNMLILPHSIQSDNFVSGALGSGFQIQDTGDAEFNSIVLRGKLTASVFEKDTISAIGGNLLVMDGDILDEDMTALDASLLTISGDTTFAVGDILRIKDGVDDEWIEVTNIASAPIYIVTRDKAGSYSPTDNPVWKKGTAVVNYGASGEGGIFLTSSESNAPYLSILTHAGSPWSATTTQLKLGNLNGFLDYVTDLYGIGIGTTNSYLKYDSSNGLRIKGSITITGGNAAVTYYQAIEPGSSPDINTPKDGDYWVDTDDSNKLYVYNTGVWQEIISGGGITTFRQSSIPTSITAGDLWIDTDDNKLYRATNIGDNQITPGEWELQDGAIATGWSHASDTTKIDGGDVYTGSITADKITTTTLSAIVADLGTITAGTVTGATLRTAATGARIVMDTTALIGYDDAGAEIFKVLISGTDVGDVIVGKSSTSYLKWDKSAATLTMQSAPTSAAGSEKIVILSNTIKIYDESNVERVVLGKLS